MPWDTWNTRAATPAGPSEREKALTVALRRILDFTLQWQLPSAGAENEAEAALALPPAPTDKEA
jgi:hypothetical protein